MAKKGTQQDFTYTDENGVETTFILQHPGLAAVDDLQDAMRNDANKMLVKEYRKILMRDVIFVKDEDGLPGQVNYAFFEEQNEGAEMLDAVTTAAQEFIFPKKK